MTAIKKFVAAALIALAGGALAVSTESTADAQLAPPAYYCVTPYGTCGMVYPVPRGSYCTCVTPYGTFGGEAR